MTFSITSFIAGKIISLPIVYGLPSFATLREMLHDVYGPPSISAPTDDVNNTPKSG